MSIERVVIIGATGRLGQRFAEELVKTGKHTVTALTRPSSKGTLPEGVKAVQVDYDDEESLVSALKGQQFLVITLAITAATGTHFKLVNAAAKAGVPYIMPNAYGSDIQNKPLRDEDLYGASSLQHCTEIEDLGASYVAMVCGFWYEWSLAFGSAQFGFGIDIKNKKAVFFDEGLTKINVSTLRQCGRALAALLNLPESGAFPSVSDWKNKPLYIASFRVSQREMLDSVHRITGTTDQDWEITFEDSAKRYKDGLNEMNNGDRMGFAKAMYSRSFYPNGDGDFESKRGLANDLIGLPKEQLDDATETAIELVKSGLNPFA